MSKKIEVVESLHIIGTSGTHGFTLHINWPGGPGKLVCTDATASGPTAKLNITRVDGDNYSYPLLADGLVNITESIVADFIAPESIITFQLAIDDGDELSIDEIYLVRC